MRPASIAFLALLMPLIAALPSPGAEASRTPRVNKLLYMYDFYYLPFSVEFREGRSVNDILPFLPGRFGEPGRLLTADELQQLDKEWNQIKAAWRTKSLLLSTAVASNKSVRVTQRIASHVIPFSRSAFDTLSLDERIQINDVLKGKSPEIQAGFRQLRFLKSFLQPGDENRFAFFIISASWCESCREYRVLFEAYFKTFSDPGTALHSVVVTDPNEQIFESRLIKELFPNPAKYTHDSVPRFLAVETVNGRAVVHEEGEALMALYDRFFRQHRGYLDSKTSLFLPGRGLSSPGRGRLDPSSPAIGK